MTAADRALQRALTDACLEAGAAEELAADAAGFLRARGVPDDEIAAMGDTLPRLAVYRRLVRNNLEGVTHRLLARTRARLNELSSGHFDAEFARFLETAGARTHYLRDVPAEFLAWAEPRWSKDERVPRWVIDLARHELTAFVVATAPRLPEPPSLVDLELAKGIAFVSTARLDAHAYAVHQLPPAEDARALPEERAVALLAYRDAEHAVKWLEVPPLAHAVLARLMAGETLQAAIRNGCAQVGIPMDDGALASIAALLADLGERGVLLGARG
jgi:hypothetical protein